MFSPLHSIVCDCLYLHPEPKIDKISANEASSGGPISLTIQTHSRFIETHGLMAAYLENVWWTW